MMSAPQQQMHNCEAAAAVSVRMTQGRGRGLFASTAMEAGTTVLIERPLVAMQTLGNSQDVTVCRNCLGFVGDLVSQLEVLSGVPRHECVARHHKRHQLNNDSKLAWTHEQRLTELNECLGGCGEVYCSSKCRSEHWARCHRLLCVGPISEEEAGDHPLVAFRIHAMQTNEIFLLVGEVMARIATAFLGKPVDGDPGVSKRILSAARAPFADFVQEPWWDVALPRTGSEERDDVHPDVTPVPAAECSGNGDDYASASFSETLRALCEESSALLRSAFALALAPAGGGGQPLPAALEHALSAEMFGRVVGMFEQNNVGIRAPSPIPGVLRKLLSAVSPSDHGGCSNKISALAENCDSKPCRSRDNLEEVVQLVRGLMEEEGSDEEEDDEVAGSCCGYDRSGVAEEKRDESKKAVDDTPAAAVKVGDTSNYDVAGNGSSLAVIRRAVDLDDSNSAGDENALFAPLDGTALYSLICCMNHSCLPNCIVQYPGRRESRGCETSCTSGKRDFDSGCAGARASADPLVAQVLLLRDVSVGEELTQSYVTREMGLVERRNALQDYGFLCMCRRCVEESECLPSP